MNLSSAEMLRRLGKGERIASVCDASGIARGTFEAWWQAECRRRVPAAEGTRIAEGLVRSVRIERDGHGIPHIHADNDRDLFFGFGHATAQDRLFQLDYLRHKARGRLAEVLGAEAVESDLLYRTLGLGPIAEREWSVLTDETRTFLTAYTAGINAHIAETRGCLPIEFDLLDYEPEPWRETDSLALMGEFRWYLTGRFPIIGIPELIKRTLGDGALYRDFILAEIDDESILHPGEYPARRRQDTGVSLAGDDGPGSNNWVLDGYRTDTGKPLVANDPHVPFFAVSIWHQAGAALAGMPGIMIGRNEAVAWGITNNICSQRDLYQEKTDPAQPGCFLYDGRWEPAQLRAEVIQVRGAESVRKTIRSTRNGPIVDDILPPYLRGSGPVSLRWLGFEPCGWLTATVGMNRARDCRELREAGRPWLCPTFNIVHADTTGNIGFHSVGRIPLRRIPERAYRPGWDPQHQWAGYIPFDEMPAVMNPKRGYVVTANNRTAPGDFPHPLSGCWNSGQRARRLRLQIDAKRVWSRADCSRLQQDVYSGRAGQGIAPLLAVLDGSSDPRVSLAASYLRGWNYHVRADSVPALLFNVFFANWCRTVCRERLPAQIAAAVAGQPVGLAGRLLAGDAGCWFRRGRTEAIRETFVAALDDLTSRLGPDMATWTWGRLHVLTQPHFLSGRGELGELFDLTSTPCAGDSATVNAAIMNENFAAFLGAGYRMVADLADPDAGLWQIEVAGVSGHVGSAHYGDQIEPWSAGELHYLPLKGDIGGTVLILEPKRII